MSARITIVGKYPPIQGGTSASVYWAANALAENKFKVQVVTNADEVEPEFRVFVDSNALETEKASTDGGCLRVSNVSSLKRGSYIPWSNPFVSKLLGLTLQVAANNESDLIVGWYFEPYGVVAALAGTILQKPVVLRHAGSDVGRLSLHPDLKSTYGWMLNNVQHILTSPRMKNILYDLGAPKDRLRYIEAAKLPRQFGACPQKLNVNDWAANFSKWASPIALPDEIIKSIQTVNTKQFDPGKTTICSYGKTGETKGSYAILQALDEVAKQRIDFNFISLACGHAVNLEKYYNLFLKTERLASCSWILPPMPPWKIPSLLAVANIGLFLENRFPISFHAPKIPREILASESCLVSSQEIIEKHPFRDSFVDGENVVVIKDPNLISELAFRIQSLLDNPIKTAMIAKHGKYLSNFIESEFPDKDPLSSFLGSIL